MFIKAIREQLFWDDDVFTIKYCVWKPIKYYKRQQSTHSFENYMGSKELEKFTLIVKFFSNVKWKYAVNKIQREIERKYISKNRWTQKMQRVNDST